ncbi:hypothetical protein FORMB_02770 [Formosa sp. Hel1_33_131]|nr:hypothetical protein FORMB_02770 [Formosa sp. Hel1_33_131]
MIKNTIRSLVFLAIFIVSNPLHAQFSNIPGTPFVKNFTEEAINNDLTVFDISHVVAPEKKLYKSPSHNPVPRIWITCSSPSLSIILFIISPSLINGK